MTFFCILFFVLGSYLTLVLGYLVLLTVAAFFFEKKTDPKAQPCSIGVIIPAHNEEASLPQTLGSIQSTAYSRDKLSVFVLADNCTDRTAQVAKEFGAQVFSRQDVSNRGKGQALDWFLRRFPGAYMHSEVLVVLDADTIPDAHFFAQVSASMAHPEVQVVQGFYGVSNPQASWRTSLVTAALSVFHHLRPAGRNRLGGTAGLKGNGMGFATQILQGCGWPAQSIVEDLEFSMQLLMQGVYVHYNPEAIVRAEMASSGEQAGSQRRRWEGGRFQILGRFALPLLASWFQSRKAGPVDGFLDLITPPLSLLVLLVLVFSLGGLIWPALGVYSLVLGLGIILYVLCGLILNRVGPRIWLALLTAPVYVLWKIPLYARFLLSSKKEAWIRTTRTEEMHSSKKGVKRSGKG